MYVRRHFEYHPVVGFRYIPNVRARCPHESGGYLVRANSAGFRSDHEFTAQKPHGVKRILLFGDSYTAGNGVSGGRRYSDVLETLLPNVQVCNFGLPGSGTDQQYLAWREFGRGMECDLVIAAVLVENIRRNLCSAFAFQRGEDGLVPKPYFDLTDAGLELRNNPVPKMVVKEATLPDSEQKLLNRRFGGAREVISKLGLKDLAQRITRHQPVPDYDDRDGRAWQTMRAILLKWKSEVQQPFMVMPIPLHHFVEKAASPVQYRLRFAELASESGCLLHDPLDDIWKHSPAERRRFRFKRDIHPTEAYHRALADSLTGALKSFATDERRCHVREQ